MSRHRAAPYHKPGSLWFNVRIRPRRVWLTFPSGGPVIVKLGSEKFTYEVSGKDFGVLPAGWSYKEATAVAVDSQDNVYVFNRGEHPVIVLDSEGTFLRSWGEGVFSNPHGVTVGPDGSVYCVDAGDHTVRKFTRDGRLLMTIGEKDRPSPQNSGEPFNRPTHTAVDLTSGELFVSDGYSNARVHKYTPEGDLLFSWGESGTGPGEFNTVHNIAVDDDGWVYVADRENHRIQVFSSAGKFETQWGNLAAAACVDVDTGGEGLVYVGQFYAGIPANPTGYGNWTAKRLGPRVSIFDTKGNLQAHVGDQPRGLEPGRFITPHGIAVDSKGDIYVAEVSYAAYGSQQDPPRAVRSLQKLVRTG